MNNKRTKKPLWMNPFFVKCFRFICDSPSHQSSSGWKKYPHPLRAGDTHHHVDYRREDIDPSICLPQNRAGGGLYLEFGAA
ncbi:MAG TPA: hypothetical protein ENN03_06655 [bacterium]|nr:hypothetical protein [bacterium]